MAKESAGLRATEYGEMKESKLHPINNWKFQERNDEFCTKTVWIAQKKK